MSPPPPAAPDGGSVSPEVRQGIIAAILGLLGMSTRVMLMEEKVGVVWVLKRLAAASVVAWASGAVLESYITNAKLLYAVVGVCGYLAPEVAQAAEDFVKAKLKAKVDEAQRAAGIKPKSNGKRTTKPKRGRK
jgi:hypothetical protein